jgi:hypothetical protein
MRISLLLATAFSLHTYVSSAAQEPSRGLRPEVGIEATHWVFDGGTYSTTSQTGWGPTVRFGLRPRTGSRVSALAALAYAAEGSFDPGIAGGALELAVRFRARRGNTAQSEWFPHCQPWQIPLRCRPPRAPSGGMYAEPRLPVRGCHVSQRMADGYQRRSWHGPARQLDSPASASGPDPPPHWLGNRRTGEQQLHAAGRPGARVALAAYRFLGVL